MHWWVSVWRHRACWLKASLCSEQQARICPYRPIVCTCIVFSVILLLSYLLISSLSFHFLSSPHFYPFFVLCLSHPLLSWKPYHQNVTYYYGLTKAIWCHKGWTYISEITDHCGFHVGINVNRLSLLVVSPYLISSASVYAPPHFISFPLRFFSLSLSVAHLFPHSVLPF